MDRPEAGARVRFPPPLVFLGGVLLGVIVRYAAIPAPVPVGRAISVASGLLVFLAGLGLIVAARINFSRTGQNPVPWTPSPSLILHGPYRFTRNPMYVGMTCIQCGIGLMSDNLWIALFAIPALMTVHVIAVRPEERYLTEKFGESYRDYLGRVRRYL